MRIKAGKRGDWVVLQRDTGRGGQKREDGQKAHQGREEKEWRSTTSYVALPLCCDYSQRPYLRIGVFGAECGSVNLKLDVRFFLMLKVKSGYRVLDPTDVAVYVAQGDSCRHQ